MTSCSEPMIEYQLQPYTAWLFSIERLEVVYTDSSPELEIAFEVQSKSLASRAVSQCSPPHCCMMGRALCCRPGWAALVLCIPTLERECARATLAAGEAGWAALVLCIPTLERECARATLAAGEAGWAALVLCIPTLERECARATLAAGEHTALSSSSSRGHAGDGGGRVANIKSRKSV